jgi:hypothetical protein
MPLSALLSTPPYDPWHDTALQTIVVAAATIITAVIPKLLERRDRREITYETTLDTPVPSMNNTHLLNIKISNTGNTRYHVNDYARPMEINLKGRNTIPASPPTVSDQTGLILDEDEQRSFFKIHPAIPQEDKIKLAPFLFQRGEALTISVMVIGSRSQDDIELSARFNYEAKIVRAKRRFIKQWWLMLPLLLGLITFILTSRLASNILVSWGVETIVTVIILLYTLLLVGVFLIAYRFKLVNF